MTTKQNIHSDLAIAPGEYLAEVLEDLGMSQAELARRMGRPNQAINEIVKGTKAITSDTALQLEKVTGVPAYLWINLEEVYRLTLARQEEEKQLEQEAELLNSDFDPSLYNAMAKHGWVKTTRNKIEKVKELLRFFGVSSLSNLADLRTYQPAFRVDQSVDTRNYALAAWLRKGELDAKRIEREIPVEDFDATKLKAILPELRLLTCEDPEESFLKVQQLLADCGVIFVILPHLPKTGAHGATFWLSPGKVVVQLSVRRGWADIFWFSLFHELAHVLLHGKRETYHDEFGSDIFVTLDKGRTYKNLADLNQEKEADTFASDTLIPPNEYSEFINQNLFSEGDIQGFSKEIAIAPGIVVGRLKHDTLLDHKQLNNLRDLYCWED